MLCEALPRSRAEAMALGLRRYFSGKPCRNGHLAQRTATGGQCVVCAKTTNRKWRLSNPERVSEHNRTSYRKYAEKRKAAWRAYYAENTEQMRGRARACRQARIALNPILVWAVGAVRLAKARAAKKAVPFDVTVEYIVSIAGTTCPVLGIELAFVAPTGGGAAPNSATLDRIDPPLGYVPGNVAVISHRANTIKNDATPAELACVAAWAAQVAA